MKSNLFFVLFIFMCHTAVCQAAYPYKDIKLEKPSDYKETEPLALSAASFLLSTPFAEVDVNRAGALEFLTNWVLGTKDYTLYLRGIAQELSTDKNLLSLYIAALVKYSLEHRSEAANPMNTEPKLCKMVLAYCDDPKNNFKLKKRYRKMLEKN